MRSCAVLLPMLCRGPRFAEDLRELGRWYGVAADLLHSGDDMEIVLKGAKDRVAESSEELQRILQHYSASK